LTLAKFSDRCRGGRLDEKRDSSTVGFLREDSVGASQRGTLEANVAEGALEARERVRAWALR
jgi:hypothetical protein